jgi:spore coat polysaccharide biosynthesis protein SpsF
MIAAIFQARLGSSRLPGKVLMNICGKPLLWHVLERVRAAETLDEIVVATTDVNEDAPLREFLEQQDVKMFIGSEDDVLDRFYQTAKHYGADVIVRITPDDPFKDPEVIDRAVRLLVEADPPVDYVSNCSYDGSVRATYPEGIDVEVMTFDCLRRMWQRADRPSEREHLTPYLFRRPDEFKTLGFEHIEDLSNLRWTIDYPRDMEFAREIYQRLFPSKPIFLMNDVLDVLQREPNLADLNKDIPRYEGYTRSVQAEY